MEKLKMHSPNFVDQNIAKIAELFPNCVTESRNEKGELQRAIDFDLLKQELSAQIVEGPQERYQLNWPGKREALLTANAPIAKTLRPCREESVDFDTTQNLFIEGDNLDALKLLQETYLGKVKMIYIDPPYNTGADFIYEDDFAEDAEKYMLRSNEKDEEGNNLVVNNDNNGRFHSAWLSMMYSRLRLARNLLEDDGVIFISIDDSETENLKKLCDEVFGADNFLNTISVNMKNIAGASGGGEDKRLKKNIEYLHIYVKDYTVFGSFENVFDYMPIDELVQKYREEDKSWKYTTVLYEDGEKEFLGTTVDGDGNDIRIYERKNFSIKSISQIMKDEDISESVAYAKYASKIFQTQMPQSSIRPRVMEKVKSLGIQSDLYSIEYVPRSGRNKGTVYEQFYKGDNFRLFAWLKDVSAEIDGVLCKKEMQGTYWDFVGETKNLTKEGDVPFQNGKKPVGFLKRMLDMQKDKDFIIMDFFAGSSSTAHAVIQKNAEDYGSRKFIMIQLSENCDKKSDAFNIGFNTISDLSKERIRRAGKKIKEENAGKEGIENLDIGFRVLKIDTSNMSEVYYNPAAIKQEDLFTQVDNVKPDRTEEDLLFQVMLDWGVDLTLPIRRETIHRKTVFFVDQNALVACFDKQGGIDDDFVKELAKHKPVRAVFRDAGFKDDAAKINVEQIFKLLSPITKVKSL